MADEYTSKLLLPKKGTVVKPEIAKEETETGKKRESAQLKVGRKILGFDVVGEHVNQVVAERACNIHNFFNITLASLEHRKF